MADPWFLLGDVIGPLVMLGQSLCDAKHGQQVVAIEIIV
jgi:hypothetical protein